MKSSLVLNLCNLLAKVFNEANLNISPRSKEDSEAKPENNLDFSFVMPINKWPTQRENYLHLQESDV